MHEKLRWINHQMMRIGRRRHQIIENAVSKLGIMPSKHYVLMQLSCMGQAASQAQIAEKMHISPASVARTLKALDADGYILRSCSGDDSRRNEISISPKGEAMVTRSREMFDELDEMIFRDFSGEELAQLSSMLERVLGNLEKIEEEAKTEVKA